MRRIWQVMQEPEWIFSVVIVSFVMSFLASYAKEWFDKLLATVSTSRRARLTVAERRRKSRVLRLASDSHYREYISHNETRKYVIAIYFSVMGIFALLVTMAQVMILTPENETISPKTIMYITVCVTCVFFGFGFGYLREGYSIHFERLEALDLLEGRSHSEVSEVASASELTKP